MYQSYRKRDLNFDDFFHSLDIEKAPDSTQQPGLLCKLQKVKVQEYTEPYKFRVFRFT